jgi:thiamine-phosphate pyrophosphorylase
MSNQKTPKRCRIVLITPPSAADVAARLEAALSGGDVASVIIPGYDLDEASFQEHAAQLTRIAQAANVASVVAGEPRIATRVQADGIHLEGNAEDLAAAIEKYQAKMMVGCGGIKTRDEAMVLGEAEPDYVFFGKFGYDNKAEAHPRNLGLGEWWSEMMQIPCIVLAGTEVASILEVANTGADFVAIGAAVFAEGSDPAKMVAEANALLETSAPRFE